MNDDVDYDDDDERTHDVPGIGLRGSSVVTLPRFHSMTT